MIKFDECGIFNFKKNFIHMRRTMRFNEFIFMTKGEMYFAIEEEKFSVKAGDILFVPSERLHYGWKESPEAVEFYYLHFLSDEVFPARIAHVENSDRVLRLFRQVMELAPCRGEDADCAATLLIHGAKREAAENGRRNTALADDIRRYISEHFSENINVSHLASLFGYSADYLSAVLRSATGMSAKNYITHCRITKSKSILLYSNLSVEETAHLCGFADAKQFFKLFKKHEGLTPSEYRRAFPFDSSIPSGQALSVKATY